MGSAIQVVDEYEVQRLNSELKKCKVREDWIRGALLESQSKWTAFSFNLLELVKQLLYHIEGTAEANLPIIRRRVQEYERFLTITDDSVSNTSSLIPVV